MIRRAAPLFVLVAITVSGCIGSVTRPVLRTPPDTFEAMREAFNRDDSGLFIHTLAAPVLKRYSDYAIKMGWGQIRPKIGALVDRARVSQVEDYTTPDPDPAAPEDSIWPREGLKAKRVTLQVDDATEDFLLVLETDPAPENAVQAKGFWVGEHYYVKREHDSPQTYLVADAPEKDRTHWRLVFPYYPFQHGGKLADKLRDEMTRERAEAEKEPAKK